MSTNPHVGAASGNGGRNRGFVAQLKQKPGKAAFLAIMVLGAAWTWGNFILGGDDRPRPAAGPTAHVSVPVGTVDGQTGTATAKPSIVSYESALQKLETWRGPLGLQLDGRDEIVIDSPQILPDEEVLEPEFDEEIELELTSTFIMGDTAIAYFGDTGVKERDVIGRYIVHSIRPGEVDLYDGENFVTVSMRKMSLGNSHPGTKQPE